MRILNSLTTLNLSDDNLLIMPMETSFLRHFGWQVQWIKQVIDNLGGYFLPIQERAIQEGGLFEGKNLLVIGPTSCGKGLVGDLCCLNQVRQDRPGIIVVPTKAL